MEYKQEIWRVLPGGTSEIAYYVPAPPIPEHILPGPEQTQLADALHEKNVNWHKLYTMFMILK